MLMTESAANVTTRVWSDLHGPVWVTEWGGNLSGPPVILTHGLGGHAGNWALLAPHLRDIGPVTALDLPGFGRSEPGDRRATIEENTAVLIRFLETLNAPAVLVGNSMGGMLAIRVAAERPDLVSRLVLLGPALPMARMPLPKLPALWADAFLTGYGFLASPLVRRLDPRLRVRVVLSFCGVDPDVLPPEHIEQAVAMHTGKADAVAMDRAIVLAARSLVSILGSPAAYRSAMASIECPVLLLHGDRDRLVPVENARAAARQHTGWTYTEFRNSGHILQLEHPEAVGFSICHWLDGVSA